MVSVAEKSASRAVLQRVPTTDRSFPGNAITGVCMIVAPLILVLSALLDINIYHAAGIDYVRGMAEHHMRAAIAFDGAVAGISMLIVAIVGLAQDVSLERPVLGRLGGLLTIVGLFGPLFFNGVYFGGFQLVDPGTQSAAGQMIDNAQIIPLNVINLSGPALVVGFILLAIGAAKAGTLSWMRALALGLCCIMPIGFISGYIVIAAIAFLGAAVALVPLGIQHLQARRVMATG